MLKIVIRNIIYTTLLPTVALFFGLVLSFVLGQLLPSDPVLPYLPMSYTQFQYDAMFRQLGLDQPLIVQFFRYLMDLFTGNLGVSGYINRGQPIIILFTDKILTSFEFTILPIVLGLIAGILLGILSVKVRNRYVKLLIQIFIILVISMPMFFIGMWSQYTLAYQLGLFPAIGDPFLPSLIVFLLTLFLTTRQIRSNYLKKSEEKHILLNSLHIIFNLSILITSIILLEILFNLNGFFGLLFYAIYDYWIFRVWVFIIIVLIAIILFLSNGVYTIYNNVSEKSQSRIITKYLGRNEQVVKEGARYAFNSDQKFKDFTVYRLKSPLTIIGLVIVVYFIIVAIFPQVLTPFSIQETLGVYLGSWDPPSVTHPLGQTKFGRDVLALLAYGVSISLKACILSVLIGITIGSLFGYLSKVHWLLKELVLGFMVIFFIVPSIFMILIFLGILGNNVIVTISIMAMYVIPGVTLIISKGNYSLKLTAKKLIAYLPLFMGVNILLFEAISFLGFSDPLLILLGASINRARENLFMAPWASLWPGLALYVLVMGFFSLHYGLKEPIPIAGRL